MLIPRREHDPATSLELQLMQNHGVAKLRPLADLAVQVRTPDGQDHLAPARMMDAGTMLVDLARIPFKAENEIVRAQLVVGQGDWRAPIDIPMGAFRWSAQSHPPEFYSAGTHARIRSESATYRAGERIHAAWQDVESPSRRDWIGVFPENAPPGKPLDRGATRGAASGQLKLVPMPPGRYVLRLLADDVRQVVAVSDPFEVR